MCCAKPATTEANPEFGGRDTPEELEFVRRLVMYAENKGIGYTAWSWSDKPFLVR
jgi:hypothetical protein